MDAVALSPGAAQQQQLGYQHNSIESSYGQDCGTYTSTLSPQLPFLELHRGGGVAVQNPINGQDEGASLTLGGLT